MFRQYFVYFSVIAATIVISTASNAYCPVLDDLHQGVILERREPAFQAVWKRTDGELTETRWRMEAGIPETITERYAHALAVSEVWRGGNIFRISYERDPKELDNLKQSDTWISQIKIAENGTLLYSGQVTYAFMGNDKIEIDNCRYEVVWVEVETRLDRAGTTYFQHAFAPSLGLSLAAYRLDEQRQPISEVGFDSVKKK